MFDLCIIGAGPVAFAALKALETRQKQDHNSLKIALVSPVADRFSHQAIPPNWHAKIKSEIKRAGYMPKELGCWDRRWPQKGKKMRGPAGHLAQLADHGGLANYWGQQVHIIEKAGLWPKEFFANHSAYKKACLHLLASFTVEGGGLLKRATHSEGRAEEPQILLSSAEARLDDGTDDGCAVRQAMQTLLQQMDIIQVNKPAERLSCHGDHVQVHLPDEKIPARRVILACGVIGTGKLLLDSFSPKHSFGFQDHTPVQLLSVNLNLRDMLARRKRRVTEKAPLHFNKLSVRQTGRYFASVYDLPDFDPRLLSNLIFTKSSAPVFKSHLPWLASLLAPIQFWSHDTQARCANFNRHSAGFEADTSPDIVEEDMQIFSAFMRELGHVVLPFYSKPSPPGDGFHYFNLTFSGGLGSNWPTALQNASGDRIRAVGGALHKTIDVVPPTLSFMASSYKIMKEDILPTLGR